ncbi:MAG: hypothetical protein QOH49_5099 [Acidobacteriota bacterium]|jgi:hypothetical protein|nr:hypothetical protein [Acidobacteriota bacterium]
MHRLLGTLLAGFLVSFLFSSAHTQHINFNSHVYPGESHASPGTSLYGSPIPPAVDPEHWMEQYAAYIAYKPYNRLAIPGTHDSGTYGVISPDERPVNDAFAPDAGSGFVNAGAVAGIAEPWSKAQDNNIYQQLMDGIRAIDLRPCVEKSGEFRICHSLYGPTMKDILRDVRRFAVAHSREIVLLRFSNFSETAPKKMSDTKHKELIKLIHDELDPNELDPTLIDHGQLGPSSLVQQIWNSKRSVVVVYAHEIAENNFWGKDKLQDSWKNTWDEDYKKTTLVDALNARDKQSLQLFNLAGQATPDLVNIGLAKLPKYPDNLKDLADLTNPVVLGWVKNEWGRGMNIVSIDFYNRTCLVSLMLQLNGVPDVSLTNCQIGTDTGWGDLRGSKPCNLPPDMDDDEKTFTDAGLFCVKLLKPYGRGVGTIPPDCPNGQEKNGGLCYAKCRDGYNAVGPVCWKSCPSGYHDDGATCRRNPDDYGNKCRGNCKKGYKNTGCTCHRDAHIIGKDSYGRGAGTAPKDCGSGQEYNAGLCYRKCDPGYHALVNICSPDCPAGMTDIGESCQK